MTTRAFACGIVGCGTVIEHESFVTATQFDSDGERGLSQLLEEVFLAVGAGLVAVPFSLLDVGPGLFAQVEDLSLGFASAGSFVFVLSTRDVGIVAFSDGTLFVQKIETTGNQATITVTIICAIYDVLF